MDFMGKKTVAWIWLPKNQVFYRIEGYEKYIDSDCGAI
jgi:hypothetical protein